MKSFVAAGALFAAAAMAQTISDLPSCSLQCIVAGITGVGCSLTDYECACTKSDALAASVTPCVQSACTDAADQAKVITVLEGICATAGFPITIPVPGATSATPEPTSAAPEPTSATPEPTPAESSAEAPSTPEASSSSEAVPETATPVYPVESSSVCSVSTVYTTITVGPSSSSTPSSYPTPSGGSNGTVTSASPSPTQFTGAASANGVTFGAAGVLGLLAYFL